MSNITTVQTSSGFLNKKTPFDNLIRRLQKLSPQNIDFMMKVVEDEKLDVKVRMDAAKTLLNAHIGLINSKNEDKIKRLTNQIRLLGKPEVSGEFSTEESYEEDDGMPLVDFDTVLTVK